jgi:predicted  nucleic acid-binding Zn-ribbon protein
MNLEELRGKAAEALAEAKIKIEELDAKKDSISAELKEEFQEKIEELRSKKEELAAKIEELEEVAEDRWDEIKDVLGDSMKSFKEGFTNLGKLFE